MAASGPATNPQIVKIQVEHSLNWQRQALHAWSHSPDVNPETSGPFPQAGPALEQRQRVYLAGYHGLIEILI